MCDEEFVDVVDFDGTILDGYDISRSGVLRSYRRGGKDRGRIVQIPRILNPTTNNYGYKMASICRGGGIVFCRQVHVLVLLAFVGPPPTPEHQCRHLNGIRDDNRLENLCWGTVQENRDDQFTHGTSAKGEKINTAKMTEDQVREIRRLRVEAKMTLMAIGKMFGIRDGTVHQICSGKTWKHVV